MKKLNKDKLCCRDVFNAYMVEHAIYDGSIEIPTSAMIVDVPTNVIAFSKINQCDDYRRWIHFYEHDYIINRIWENPNRYINQIKKFDGVIMPDFSLYRDMPLIWQYYNIFRSRAVGTWLTEQGVKCIPNIRFGDYRTFEIACLGIPKGTTIAIGSHGSMRERSDRMVLEAGIEYALTKIRPNTLVLFGTVSDNIRSICEKTNTKMVRFESDIALAHKKESEVK